MHSKRRLVVLAVVGALVATAGCSGILGSTTTAVVFVNNDEQHHDATVEVLNDGDVVYSETVAAEPNSNNDLRAFEGSGEYTVAVTVNGTTTEQRYEFSGGSDTLSVGVQNDGSVVVDG